MARSGRNKREPVWGPNTEGVNAEDVHDAIDSVFDKAPGPSTQPALREVTNSTVVRESSSPATRNLREIPSTAPVPAPSAPAVELANVAALSPRPPGPGGDREADAGRKPAAKQVARRRGRGIRPPEASIAYAVYTRLLAVSADEKHQKGLAARPYGVIVMDALDRHASTLQKHWTETPTESAPSSSLFVRSDTALLRRRRTGSKKTIPLSGISAENRRLLDRYAQDWNAGGRSALVEEALRLEFGMPPSDDAPEDSRA